MKFGSSLVLTGLSLLAYSLSHSQIASAIAPADLHDRIEAHLDLPYATYGDRSLQLDLYRPKDAEAAIPAVLCLHGGAWWKGDRKNFEPIAQALADRGYVVATISYRLSGEAPFPAQIHDCKAAVRWLRANAATYGIDPDAIGATGSSAGGHLAALLATSGGVEELEGAGGNPEHSSAIQAAAPMGAQSDLESKRIAARSKDPNASFYPQFLGGTQEEAPENYRLASPLHHLDKDDPPMLFLSGELDDESTHAYVMRRKMAEFGIPEKLHIVDDGPHGFPNQERFFDETIVTLDEFFSRFLKKKPDHSEAPSRTRPNILFVIADDLRPELGCYGSELGKTPHIDSLARSGMTFHHAYCQKALCWPSRNSLLSGLLPANLGKANSEETFRASHPDIVSLPEWFKENGWFTRGFGKILHNGQDDPQSWSESLYEPPPLHYARPENKDKHPVVNRSVPANRENPLFEAAEVDDDAYEDGHTATAAADAIRSAAQKGEPFFFMVGFHKPHSPFNAPQRYWDLYDHSAIPLSPVPKPPENAPLDFAVHDWKYLRSFAAIPEKGPMPDRLARDVRHGYLACVSYIDALTGRLVAALEESGARDNTIVVFTSDHGYHLGDHSMWSKHTTFEVATRVPLIFSGPGIPERAHSRSMVELLDLFPTLSAMAGLDVPDHVEGQSFAPVLADPSLPARSFAYSEFERNGARGHSVRTRRFRYTEWRDLDTGEVLTGELYDHRLDPLESASLAEDPTLAPQMLRLSRLLVNRIDKTELASE